MTVARIHPELMSKPVLIQQWRDAQRRAEEWRRRYVLEQYANTHRAYYEPTPEETLRDAKMLLEALGPDPQAVQHREDLLAGLDEHASINAKNGRCMVKDCSRRLDDQGRCLRHDWRARKAEREAS